MFCPHGVKALAVGEDCLGYVVLVALAIGEPFEFRHGWFLRQIELLISVAILGHIGGQVAMSRSVRRNGKSPPGPWEELPVIQCFVLEGKDLDF